MKRFRGRPCVCAESDACSTFEAIKRFPIQRRRKVDPEIVSPRRFFGYLLSEQKVTYKIIMEDCDSLESRSSPPPHSGGLQLADGSCMSYRRRRTAHQKSKIQSAAFHSKGPRNCAAKRRYLRRLAPVVRPPQPPKINFGQSAVGKQAAARISHSLGKTANKSDSALDFSYFWLRLRYSRSAKCKRACFCSRLFVSLQPSLSMGNQSYGFSL